MLYKLIEEIYNKRFHQPLISTNHIYVNISVVGMVAKYRLYFFKILLNSRSLSYKMYFRRCEQDHFSGTSNIIQWNVIIEHFNNVRNLPHCIDDENCTFSGVKIRTYSPPSDDGSLRNLPFGQSILSNNLRVPQPSTLSNSSKCGIQILFCQSSSL